MKKQITFKEVDLTVEFDHQPEERADRDHPGCHESIELSDIYHEGVSFLEIMEPHFEKIEELVWKALKDA